MATRRTMATGLTACLTLIAAACPSASAQCRPEWLPGAAAPDYPLFGVTGVEFDDGQGPKLYCGGAFQAIGHQLVRGLTRWTGTHWEPVPGWPGGRVRRVEVVDGTLWVARKFGPADEERSDILRWDGATWAAVVGPRAGTISSFAQLGSQVFVIPDRTDPGAPIERWDGAMWRDAGEGLVKPWAWYALQVFNGQLYLGQDAYEPGSHVVMRWDDANQQWGPSTTPAFTGIAASLAVYNGELVASGDFRAAPPALSPSLGTVMRYRNGTWEPLGTDLGVSSHGPVATPNLLITANGRLYAGGDRELLTPDWPAHWPPPLVSLAVWDGTAWTSIDRPECGFNSRDPKQFAFMSLTRDGPVVAMIDGCSTFVPAIHQAGSWRDLSPTTTDVQRLIPTNVLSYRGELIGLSPEATTEERRILAWNSLRWETFIPSPPQGQALELISTPNRLIARVRSSVRVCDAWIQQPYASALVEWTGAEWRLLGHESAPCPQMRVASAAAVGDDVYVVGCLQHPPPTAPLCGVFRQRTGEDFEYVADGANDLVSIRGSEGGRGELLGVRSIINSSQHIVQFRLWTGTAWEDLDPWLRGNVYVRSAVWHEGELVIGLSPRSGAWQHGNLLRWNGIVWSDWPVSPGYDVGTVLSIRGRLIVHVDGRVLEWDGAAWKSAASVEGSSVSSTLKHRGELAVVGNFDAVSGVISARVAMQGCTCPGDFDSSGGRGVEDVLAYLAAWFDRRAAADTDASGAVGLQDLFDFLDGWFGVCR